MDVNQTYGDHFTIHTNIDTLCCIPEKKKKKKTNEAKSWIFKKKK